MTHTNDVFLAVSHPVRRSILERLRAGELPAGRIAEPFEISRPAVSKHLAVLRRAGLVIERKHGRELLYQLNTEMMEEARDWLNRFWDNRLTTLKQLAERKS
ncbi:metalloregulator ArsR/SmtB family transcription factor [Hyphobacterium sp.]|uniref:metalloregulator ArsR/SmtB family transcription factor n=1 Tax=Hyphobacterium sp. TaxID=2004662 RepID=UPI003BAAD96F